MGKVQLYSIFDVVVLIGIVQGLVMACLLLAKKERRHDQVLLAGVLLVFVMLSAKILLHSAGLWQNPFFRYLPLPFELAIQPLIWMYVSRLVRGPGSSQPFMLLHFLPFFASLAYSLFVYLRVLSTSDLAVKDSIAEGYHFNAVKQWEDYLSVLSSVLYWWLGYLLIARYRLWLFTSESNTDFPTYRWLKTFSVLTGVLIVMLGVNVSIQYLTRAQSFLPWQLFFVYLSFLIYWMGVKGYQLTAVAPDSQQRTPPSKGRMQAEINEAARILVTRALEEDHLYLDPELSLQKLASHTGLSTQVVSVVINRAFDKNFRNLINWYRVERVKRELADTGSRHYSLLGIAYRCGFNSEASFYRIFKQVTGMSPKAYLDSLRRS